MRKTVANVYDCKLGKSVLTEIEYDETDIPVVDIPENPPTTEERVEVLENALLELMGVAL